MTKKISKDLELKIIDKYKYHSEKELAKIFNRSVSGIRLILERNNVKKLKKSRINMSHLSLNIDYFKNIDSPDKAYWLGFLCADGNINKHNNKVSLVSKDKCVIENFKKNIKSEHKISTNIKYDKRTNKTYTGYSIQIGNELFTRNLINLGVTSDKSNTLKFPKINEKYYSYFIAGLFDGDGSLNMINDNLRCSLISTKEILIFIKKYIREKYSIKSNKIYKVTNNKPNIWKITWYSDSLRFLNFIYHDDQFQYLNRKYLICLNNLEKIKNKKRFNKVLQYDLNMKLIKIWDTIKDASNYLKCHENTLNYNVKRNNKYKNYIWKHEK